MRLPWRHTPRPSRSGTTTGLDSALAEDKTVKEIKEVMDIVFVMDATASMDPYIKATRDQIIQMMDRLIRENPHADIKVAIIGFRDYGDDTQVRDFTTPEKAKAFLQNLRACNNKGENTDWSENPELGTLATDALSWREPSEEIRRIRTVFLCTDAPPHAATSRGGERDIRDRYLIKYSNPIERHYLDEATRLAETRGATINTMLCGSYPLVEHTLREIATLGGGQFFKLEKTGENIGAVATAGVTTDFVIDKAFKAGGAEGVSDHFVSQGMSRFDANTAAAKYKRRADARYTRRPTAR